MGETTIGESGDNNQPDRGGPVFLIMVVLLCQIALGAAMVLASFPNDSVPQSFIGFMVILGSIINLAALSHCKDYN